MPVIALTYNFVPFSKSGPIFKVVLLILHNNFHALKGFFCKFVISLFVTSEAQVLYHYLLVAYFGPPG